MGKTSVMALLAFLVIGGTRSASLSTTHRDTEARDSETRLEMLSRNAALVGYERAKQALADHGSSTTLSDQAYHDGESAYTATVSYEPSTGYATVQALGKANNVPGTAVDYRVTARLQRIVTLPTSAPQFMQFALLTNDDLTLNGNVSIDTFRVEGDTRAPANANIHTNKTIKVSGATALVRGFGTYSVSENVSHTARVFKPYSNPTNAAVLSKASSVTLPSFTAAGLADSLGRDKTSGVTVLSGTLDFTSLGATRENPYVWYVNGSVAVSADTKIKGYVVFVVSGDVVVLGNDQVSLNNGYAESNAAWYLNGTLTLKGNTEIWGQFYTRGNVVFSGTPSIYGSVISAKKATISGTPKIYYVAPSPALTTAWQEGDVSLVRLSYSEGW